MLKKSTFTCALAFILMAVSVSCRAYEQNSNPVLGRIDSEKSLLPVSGSDGTAAYCFIENAVTNANAQRSTYVFGDLPPESYSAYFSDMHRICSLGKKTNSVSGVFLSSIYCRAP